MPFAEDTSLFFEDENGFAVEAVFGLASGDATRRVIFHDPTQPVEVYETQVEAEAPFLMMQEADLEGVVKGVSVDVAGGSYRVARAPRRDGTGLALVFLN